MSTIQNLKNFIRHGKQARNTQNHAEPTTKVASVHAQGQPHVDHRQPAHHGLTEPAAMDSRQANNNAAHPQRDFTTSPVDQRNNVAHANAAVAAHAGQNQKMHESKGAKSKDVDPAILERIVAEERESKGKLPKYPGLDRFKLVEKMGDGAFSNVYRAKDLTGEWNEVAIKVVRKFEMNASQVRTLAMGSGAYFLLQAAAGFCLLFCRASRHDLAVILSELSPLILSVNHCVYAC